MKKFNGFEKLKKVKLSSFGKRQIILCSLILLIAVAGYINLNYNPQETLPASKIETNINTETENNDETAVAPVSAKADEFSEMRLNRDKKRSESNSVYREIIDNTTSTAEARSKAQDDLELSSKAAENENTLESLIKAKKFDDVVCYINGNNVSIIIKSDGLVASEVAQIKDMVIDTTGVDASNIKVVER